MALKYQALNGTVISKTTTIEGFDVNNIGSPSLLRGVETISNNVKYKCIFVGFGAPNTSATSFKNTDVTDTYTLYAPTGTEGAKTNVFYFRYAKSTKTHKINGTLTFISKVSGEILTQTWTPTGYIDFGAGIFAVTIPYVANQEILSITFTPAT